MPAFPPLRASPPPNPHLPGLVGNHFRYGLPRLQTSRQGNRALKPGPGGGRNKDRAGRDTVKPYDKQGSGLRAETTLNEVKGLRSDRTAADDPAGPRAWRPMRKGVAEMARRATK